MEQQEGQRFLQAEETVEKLAQTLKQLQTEAASYAGARQELDSVRTRLLGLIDSTEQLTVASHGIIKVLREIGAPQIMDRLLRIENQSTEEFTAQSKHLGKLKSLIVITLVSSVIAVILAIVGLLT